MQQRDPLKSLEGAEYFVMVSMASMMLRGLGEMLQQYRNLAPMWAPVGAHPPRFPGSLRDRWRSALATACGGGGVDGLGTR